MTLELDIAVVEEVNVNHGKHVARVRDLITGMQLLLNNYRVYVQPYRCEIWCTVIGDVTQEDKAKLLELGWQHNQAPMAWWFEV